MSDHYARGGYRRTKPKPRAKSTAARRFETAEDCIYEMPTDEQVVDAGYVTERWQDIKRERDAFIARFNSDPDFAAKAREHARKEWEAHLRRVKEGLP